MIFGAHVLFYSKDPKTDRAFFRDVLQFPSVDVGGGWLIFKLPPAEAAFHPVDEEVEQVHAGHRLLGAVLYLMCDDLRSMVESLQSKGIVCAAIDEEDWGIQTSFRLPSGGEIGLYQPKHPTALELAG
jgi:hypothetical protein